MRRSLALVIASSLASCSSMNSATSSAPPATDAGSTTTAGGALPCDVSDVLARACVQCHSSPPQFGAPMALTTLGAARAEAAKIRARIHDDARPMPPPPNARLGAADLATLDSWIDRGAPAGDGACSPPATGTDAGAPSGGDDGGATSDCVPDLHIAPATPFTMTSSETYACYGFDVPNGPKRHVTEIRVRVDNSKIVHHALLLKSPVSTGGTPTPCSPGPTLASPMLYAWAPGGNPLVVPAEAGFPQDGTTHYVVQIHYNNAANAPSPTDATGFDLCTTDHLRANDADVLAFGTESIVLPARASSTTTTCFTASSSLDGRHVFAAFPHMHKLGSSIATTLVPGGNGQAIDMGADPHWDFSNQPWLPLDAVIHSGDVVRTQCTWNNTTDSTVGFGQGTGDEMCYSFTAYYPIANPSLGWSAPATLSAGCQ